MTIACPSCGGRKQVMKLGMVMGQCDNCKGVGKVKRPEPIDFNKLNDATKVFQEVEMPEPKINLETGKFISKEASTYGKKKGK